MKLSFSLPALPYRDDTLFGLSLLTLVCVTLGFTSFVTEGFESVKLTLWLLGVGGMLATVWVRRSARLVVAPAVWMVLGFLVLWFALGAFGGNDVVQSLFGGAGRYVMTVIAVVLWAVSIVLASGDWAARSDKQLFVVKVVAWLGGLVAVLAIAQQFGVGYYPGASASFRFLVPGFLGNQNFTAMYLVGVLPVVWWLWENSTKWPRVGYGLLQTIIVWELALTSSRGALVALAVAYLGWLMVLLWFRRWRTLAVSFAVSLVVAVFVVSQFSPLLREIGVSTNLKANANIATIGNRQGIWLDTVDIISQHAWLGIGAGNALTVPQPLAFLSNVTVERFDDVHNVLLNLGLAGGVPLVFFFLIFVGLVLWRAVRAAWHSQDTLALLIVLAVVSLLVAALFNPLVLPCWLLLAVLLAWLIARTGLVDVVALGGLRRGLVGVLAVLLLVYAACFMTSLVFTRLAETAYKQQRYDHSMQWGRRAVTLLPWNTQAQHFVVMSLYRQQSPRDQLVMGIERLSRWYRSFPGQLQERAQLYFLLYQRFGQPADQAAMNDTLTTLATIEPYAGFTYSFAANLYYQTGQLDQALAAITQYLSTPQRRNQYSWLLLAQIQLARGQQALAEKALRQAYAAESYPTPFRNQIGTLVRSGLEGVTSLPFMFATE